MSHYKEKSEIKVCGIGSRVTEGTYSAIVKYCQKVGMSIGELVEYSVSNWIANDANIEEDVKKFFLMRTAEMKKQMYEEQNEIIMKSMKEIDKFEKDLCDLISKDASNTMIKVFIENKVNSIISGIVCLDSLGEGKKLLRRLYDIVGKWRPNLTLKSNNKTLTLTFSEGLFNMHTLYISKKKIHSRLSKKVNKTDTIRRSPRYQKRLSEIKEDKGDTYVGHGYIMDKDHKLKEK